MEELSQALVRHIADLANLPLTPEETFKFKKQLAETLDYINHLREIETKNVNATSQVTGKVNEFREDKIVPSLSQEEALRNAPQKHKGFFVAKIIWE